MATELLPNKENYYVYTELSNTGRQVIHTKDINMINWKDHLDAILNIMKDGIETEFVQNMFINVVFADGLDCDLSLFDYYFNLVMWHCIINAGGVIKSKHLFFPENITQKSIKIYIDNKFIDEYRKSNFGGTCTIYEINRHLNNMIDSSLSAFSYIDIFSLYLANTINIEDTIDLMNKYPRFNELMHADLSGIPIEDVKKVGMEYTNEVINFIINSDHCLSDSFRAEEGISPKQFKEFQVNIGSKPDGRGGIFPTIINRSFLNGGVCDIPSTFIESSGGRTAQIIAKCNVGTSGHFARLLGLNNRDTILNDDMNYVCDSVNFEEVTITSERFLKWFNGRYYRLNPDGMEYKLDFKKDKHLIGKKIYLRSPMTCASAARGEGICYRCYGSLAYTNCNINVGQLASELLSSALTQRLLSAKHLLESAVRKLEWCPDFYNFFEIDFNIITLIDDFDYTGYKLLIDPDNIYMESEEDDFDYNEYITQFQIKDPSDNIYTINTKDYDSIYISNSLNGAIRKSGEPVEGNIEIDLKNLEGLDIFLVYITNNELSKTLEMVKSIINKKAITESFDRNSILQKFVETVIEGGLNTISIHLEVILSNQIRAIDDILQTPDWTVKNDDYQLITLNDALTYNPSITTTMSYQKLSKTLYSPLSFRKNKPSFLDLLFMEKPQEFMVNESLISNKYKRRADKEPMPFIIYKNKK